MKVNYPIKWAAMPIMEQVGWVHGLNELEMEYGVVCYIVSKCYLISETTTYAESGASTKEYEVVFPYQPGGYDRWQRVLPSYNLINKSCVNGIKVDSVFETFDEAKAFVDAKNTELCKNSYLYLPYSEDYAERIQAKKDEFNEKISKYKKLEKQISFFTQCMEVGKNTISWDVIKFSNNQGSVSSYSIFELLSLLDRNKFVVYSVTPEQYIDLIKLFEGGKPFDIHSLLGNYKGLLTHTSVDDFIKLAIGTSCGAYYIQNDKIKYDASLDKVSPESFDDIDDDTMIFFTVETIADLLNSYKTFNDIDLSGNQGTSLVKELKL